MFAEIILSQRFPKNMGIFDYKVPDYLANQIKLGQLVNIPFRKGELEGIVIKIKKQAIVGKQIKEITKIFDQQPMLTETQIKLAEWISQYYFVSLGTVIKTILPAVPKRKSGKLKSFSQSPIPEPKLPMEISNLIYGVNASKKQKFLFWPKNLKEKNAFFYWLLKRTKQNILIIVPEFSDMDFYLRLLPASAKATAGTPEKLQKETAVFTSQLNKNQFYQNWQKVVNNQAKIVIGTKLALFAPFQKLNLIIFDQEEDQNHKQSDQNPRFDSRNVALKLAELHDSKIVLASHAPSVESYQQIKNRQYQLLQSELDNKLLISLVDMREEIKKRNYSIFSDQLIDATKEKIEKNEKIFLFINHRGYGSSVICRDCGEVAKCKNCDLPLIYHTTSDAPQSTSFLYCHHCHIKSEMPPFCPKCHGANLKLLGLGTQKVESEIKKLYPKAKVIRIDKDIGHAIDFQKTDIIIGTEYALKYLDFEKIKLIGVVSADTFLYLPDFQSTIRTFQLLTKFPYLSPASEIIIQTYTPENLAIKNIVLQKYEKIYQKELESRQIFHYPPFYQIIKLIYQNKYKRKCLSQTNWLYHELSSWTKKQGLNWEISILTPFVPITFQKWQMYIIAKYPANISEKIIKEMIKLVPDGWLIDREPTSLL